MKSGVFHAVNPATGERLEPAFHSATIDDVDRVANLAADAFAIFRNMSGSDRGRLLRRIAANLESKGPAIVERAHAETALPNPRLEGELARTCGQLRLFATLVEEGSWVDARIDHADRDRKPAPKPDLRSMLRPIGPVAVFGASNFPLAFSVAGGDTASALAAGCPVVVKAHPAHPGTSELAGAAIRQALRDCHLPAGAFGLLFDAAFDAGIRLVQHPAIRAAAFTGSHRGGQALMDAIRQRPDPIPFYAEMGSVNPVFILPGAMRERGSAICAGLYASVTLGAGQFCTNPGLVIAHGDGLPKFVGELEAKMSACEAMTMLTAGIAGAYRTGIERLESQGGVERRAGVAAEAGRARAALFVTNAAAFIGNAALGEEVFGPSTLVVECGSGSALLDVARSLEGQLTVTVHGTEGDLAEYRELFEILETKAGRIIVNGFPTGVEVAHSMVHGGPWPATSDGRSTSVGTRAIVRFARPVCYQDFPNELLPDELKEANPLGILRLVDGRVTVST
ncbi:MAG TPA: aldehyde dehydrogenase (NADP(+)) [Thermoanaerobaculia bacterium]|nr:aldehyde dehydrogenase (NADP(+)) [Thermoanaerobaculia bacterium]